jgi:hypothetical protein
LPATKRAHYAAIRFDIDKELLSISLVATLSVHSVISDDVYNGKGPGVLVEVVVTLVVEAARWI